METCTAECNTRYSEVIKNTGQLKQRRIMIGIPMTGLVRAEWMLSRYGQVIPCNWSQVDSLHWLDQFSPLEFMVADARNILVDRAVNNEFEWLLQIDHDVVLPRDCFIRINQHMLEKKVPFLSGLYFTKSVPAEPLIYRGRGTSYYNEWKLGDKVWVDGVPSGLTLIHVSILKALWEESPSYEVMPGTIVKEVYKTPSRVWFDPESNNWYSAGGTEDLELCTRIMENNIFEKAGWSEYKDKEFPFLCDTGIFAKHIDNLGIQYPTRGEEQEFNGKVNDNKQHLLEGIIYDSSTYSSTR